MRFLVQFAAKHLEDFALPELDSVCKFYGIQTPIYDEAAAYELIAATLGTLQINSFLIVELPSVEVAITIATRAILIKRIFEPWGEGATLADVVQSVKRYPEELKEPHFAPTVSWSINVAASGYTRSEEEQKALRNHFSFLPFEGAVKCKRPDQAFWLIEKFMPENATRLNRSPEVIYFARELCFSGRSAIVEFSLKQRRYLGPTALDAELSLVMANMALVGKGSVVMDPFVGTASILVACARLGAVCLGMDIDAKVLHGKNGATPFSNFEQYGLPRPELMRSDNAHFGSQFRPLEWFDAVLCDPPYGIRAGARKSGVAKEVSPVVDRETFAQRTQPYAVEEVLEDMLEMAARSLRVGGRLCYLLPGLYDMDVYQDLPQHPCLRLLHHSVQALTTKMCRRLITMEKVCAYDMAQEAHYREVLRSSYSSGAPAGEAYRPFAALRSVVMDKRVSVPLNVKQWKRQQHGKVATADEGAAAASGALRPPGLCAGAGGCADAAVGPAKA